MQSGASSSEGVVRSAALAFLVLAGHKPERFLCLSDTFSGGGSPEFAQARLCTAAELVAPVIVRGRPFRSRAGTVSDGTPLGGSSFLVVESSQAPPGQGHPLVLAVGTGGDASVADAMWRSGFPTPNSASAAGLTSDVPMQTPLFMASARPELSVFLVMGVTGDLYYGSSFQLLSHYGYLSGSSQRPSRLTLHLDPTPGCYWRLLPYSTFYSSFPPDGCLAHSPNPTSLLALTCSASGCSASGRRVFLSGALCEQEAQQGADDEPEPRAREP